MCVAVRSLTENLEHRLWGTFPLTISVIFIELFLLFPQPLGGHTNSHLVAVIYLYDYAVAKHTSFMVHHGKLRD